MGGEGGGALGVLLLRRERFVDNHVSPLFGPLFLLASQSLTAFVPVRAGTPNHELCSPSADRTSVASLGSVRDGEKSVAVLFPSCSFRVYGLLSLSSSSFRRGQAGLAGDAHLEKHPLRGQQRVVVLVEVGFG